MRFFFEGLAKAKVAFKTQILIQGKSGKRYLADGVVTPNINVEIDGASHRDPKQKVKDQQRDQDICANNWVVIRFSNWEVWNKLAACVATTIKLIPEDFRP